MKPRVSVVIVSYRSRGPLEECLDSLRQCAERILLEVVVVDNASGDGTVEWLSHHYPEVRAIGNADNVGFTRGVNQGLAASEGNLLFVLNPDCRVSVDALERLIAALEHHPDAAAVAPMLLEEDGTPARSCGRFPTLWSLMCDHLNFAQMFPRSALFGAYKYGGRDLATLGHVDWASGAALLIPRAVYERLGGLDERIFMYMEEVDWCFRAAGLGLHVRFVPDARIIHLGQQSSRQVPGKTYLYNLQSRVYYFRKHHGAASAVVAKGILILSLACKWLVAVAKPPRAGAEVYAAGMGVVWAA